MDFPVLRRGFCSSRHSRWRQENMGANLGSGDTSNVNVPFYKPAICASLWIATAAPLRAEILSEATVGAQYEHNSNIFALQSGLAPVPGRRGRYDEDSQFYSGAMKVQYRQGQQSLLGDVAGVLARHGNYTGLDHSAYNASVRFDWRLFQSLYGTAGVKQSRAMISFAELNVPELVIQAERVESAGIRLQPNPRWRIEGDAYRRNLNEPLPTVPSLRLRETWSQGGFMISPTTNLTFGPRVNSMRGEFTAATIVAPSYRQNAAELYLDYRAPNGATQLTVRGGHTRRTSSFSKENVSGATGELNLQYNFTPRTSYQFWVTRAVDNYITNLGADIDTRTALNLNFRPTYKIRVTLGYVWSNLLLPKQGNAPVGSDRHDRIQTGTLKVDYAARRWLTLRPYVIVQTRSSNLSGGNFDSTSLGLTLEVTWRNFSDER
jgi:hypothetical protein